MLLLNAKSFFSYKYRYLYEFFFIPLVAVLLLVFVFMNIYEIYAKIREWSRCDLRWSINVSMSLSTYTRTQQQHTECRENKIHRTRRRI